MLLQAYKCERDYDVSFRSYLSGTRVELLFNAKFGFPAGTFCIMCNLSELLDALLINYIKCCHKDNVFKCCLTEYDLLGHSHQDFFVVFDFVNFQPAFFIVHKSRKHFTALNAMSQIEFVDVVNSVIEQMKLSRPTLHFTIDNTTPTNGQDIQWCALILLPDREQYISLVQGYQHLVPDIYRKYLSQKYNWRMGKFLNGVAQKVRVDRPPQLWYLVTSKTNDDVTKSIRRVEGLRRGSQVTYFDFQHESLPLVIFGCRYRLRSKYDMHNLLCEIKNSWFRHYRCQLQSSVQKLQVYVNWNSDYTLLAKHSKAFFQFAPLCSDNLLSVIPTEQVFEVQSKEQSNIEGLVLREPDLVKK